MTTENIIQTLADGLILRTATIEDSEALAKFNGTMHADPGEDFAEHLTHWTRDLLNGEHPTTRPQDFTIVEDTHTGEIVSSMCLIGQTWSYEGIEFPVGRPELVATHPDFRRRGLVRKQFDIVHQWAEERGHKMQFITGIPWYYRQFGYEMAVNLGGRRQGSVESIPVLKEEEEEPFRFRPAEEKDIPFLAELYQQNSRRNLLSCVRGEELWQYELNGRNVRGTLALLTQIIETPEGGPVGYLSTLPILFSGNVQVGSLEIVQGVSWFEAAAPVLRQIKKIGEGYAKRDATEDNPISMTGFSFNLGEDHPIYHMIPNRIPLVQDPYAFYIRIADLPGFLRMVVPVLEERLAGSYMCGHTGELKLNFYQSGVEMAFEKGKIVSVEPWEQAHFNDASANFTGLTFTQLLLGYRDVDALEQAFQDIYYPKEGTKYLLGALFPRKPSWVMAFG